MNTVTILKKKTDDHGRLTAKQEAFSRLVVESEDTLLSNYKRVYDCSQMSDESASVEASRLLRHPKVAPRVAELRAKIDAKTILTGVKLKDHVILRLLEISQQDNPAAVRALELLGRSEQLFADKKVSSIAEQSSDQIEKELIDRLAKLAR